MNGIETTRQSRKLAPATRILILSMWLARSTSTEHFVPAPTAMCSRLPARLRWWRHCGASTRERYISEAVSNLMIGDMAAERRAAHDPLGQLTDREREVLRLTAEGYSSAASAKLLALSPKTVETYRSRIMRKLEVRNVIGL